MSGIRKLLPLLALMAPLAFAHIKNEGSQFPDIEFSNARYDIVLLVGAGIIPETPVYEPDLRLTKEDLASWAALATGLGEGGETPDTRKLAQAALDAGLLDSLEGEVSYGDINTVLFDGRVTATDLAAVPTRDEAAAFIAEHLTDTDQGVSLLSQRGMKVGPNGPVTSVESRMNPDGGSSYFITIAGETYPMYSHGRVANGPTDLLQWQGRDIRKSFLKDDEGLVLWVYLEAEPVVSVQPDAAAAVIASDAVDVEAAVQTDHNLLYGLVIAVLALGVLLFFKSKRS